MSRAVFRSRADLDARGFDSGIRGMHKRVDGFKAKMGGMRGTIARGLAVGAVVKMGRGILEMAADFDHMSSRANISTDAFQSFNAVAVDTGAKTKQVGTFMAKLRQQQFEAVKGNKVVSESLQALGVNLSQVGRMTTQEFIEAVAKGYEETRNFGALVKLTSTENAPKMEAALISLGKNGFKPLTKEMEDAGRILDQGFTKSLEKADTAIGKFFGKIKIGLVDSVGGFGNFFSTAFRQLNTGESIGEIRHSEFIKKKYEEKKRRESELAALESIRGTDRGEGLDGQGTTQTIRGQAVNRFGSLRRVGGNVLGSGRTENLFKENVAEVKKTNKLLEQVVDNTSETNTGGSTF